MGSGEVSFFYYLFPMDFGVGRKYLFFATFDGKGFVLFLFLLEVSTAGDLKLFKTMPTPRSNGVPLRHPRERHCIDIILKKCSNMGSGVPQKATFILLLYSSFSSCRVGLVRHARGPRQGEGMMRSGM